MSRTGRLPRTRRPTPHVDAWRSRIAAALEPRGATMELARYLADGDARKVKQCQVKISRAVHGGTVPDGELVLAVEAWLATRPA